MSPGHGRKDVLQERRQQEDHVGVEPHRRQRTVEPLQHPTSPASWTGSGGRSLPAANTAGILLGTDARCTRRAPDSPARAHVHTRPGGRRAVGQPAGSRRACRSLHTSAWRPRRDSPIHASPRGGAPGGEDACRSWSPGTDAREVVRRVPKIRGGLQPLAAELAPPPVAPLLEPHEPARCARCPLRAGGTERGALRPLRSGGARGASLRAAAGVVPARSRPGPRAFPWRPCPRSTTSFPRSPDDAAGADRAPGPGPRRRRPDAASTARRRTRAPACSRSWTSTSTRTLTTQDLTATSELEGTGSSVAALGAAVSLLPPAESLASPEPADAGAGAAGALDVHGWFTDLPQAPDDEEAADPAVAADPLPVGDAVPVPAAARRRVLPALVAALLGGVLGFQLEPLVGWPSEEATLRVPTVTAPVAVRDHSGLFSTPAFGRHGPRRRRVLPRCASPPSA